MRFSLFMQPLHALGENPTLALERDLESIEWWDALGYDEVFIGEHHSSGWETIASPAIMIAAAAARTPWTAAPAAMYWWAAMKPTCFLAARAMTY